MAEEGAGQRIEVVANVLFVLALFVATLLSTGREVVRAVTMYALTPTCDVAWYAERSALVLTCVGRDYVRLWPLPVVLPWFED